MSEKGQTPRVDSGPPTIWLADAGDDALDA